MIAEIQNHGTMEMRTQSPRGQQDGRNREIQIAWKKKGKEWNICATTGPQDHSQSLTKPQHHKAAAKYALESTPCRNTKEQAQDNAGRRYRALRSQKRRNAERQEDELKKELRKKKRHIKHFH